MERYGGFRRIERAETLGQRQARERLGCSSAEPEQLRAVALPSASVLEPEALLLVRVPAECRFPGTVDRERGAKSCQVSVVARRRGG